jgi:hypothetical protein
MRTSYVSPQALARDYERALGDRSVALVVGWRDDH